MTLTSLLVLLVAFAALGLVTTVYRAGDTLDLIGIEISPARLKCALLSLDTVAHALADRAAAQSEADPNGG
jgi:NifU-like protein involved in Fe-S cluster formation